MNRNTALQLRLRFDATEPEGIILLERKRRLVVMMMVVVVAVD